MSAAEIIRADYAFVNGAIARDVYVKVDDAGMIVDVSSAMQNADRHLRDQILLPGFVNAHSHAFQRGLRGRGETFTAGRGSFWSWREAMYSLVESLDVDRVRELSRQAFAEMRDAGITTVGEFHYIHHADVSARDYAFDAVVLGAARDVGIRIALIMTYYEAGGFEQPLAGGQLRFATPTLESFFARVDALCNQLDERTQSLAVAGHSIRAVPIERLATLHEGAVQRGLPFHMHLEEQRKEIADCEAALGDRPLEIVLRELPTDAAITAVHATHTPAATLEKLLARGGQVCMCPLTEANLGDGIADVPSMNAADHGICLGTDSNARISMLEEMRWLEYVQRLRLEQRGVCCDATGNVGPRLLESATVNGAGSLNVKAGKIAAGCVADFCVIDRNHASLAFCDDGALANAICLGAADDAIRATCVGGNWRETGTPVA